MSLRTKSIFDPIEDTDGIRILITRYHPRGVKKERYKQWIRELSPSSDLLMEYKKGKTDWGKFVFRLVRELSTNIDSREAILSLNDLMKYEVITLLCYERDRDPCHRHIVADLIRHPDKLDSNDNNHSIKVESALDMLNLPQNSAVIPLYSH